MQNLSALPANSSLAALFAEAIAPLGPFESRPHLAIAVSGGADSMALLLLANEWASTVGGCVTALTVDHKLRPESSEEAQQVKTWVEAQNIAHEILTLEELPDGNVQANARNARYEALSQWCLSNHVLHLLTAHHADDQAETILMREARKEASLGAAGMSALRCADGVRILRPLLGIHKTLLVEHLQACGQEWIEDPSNSSEQFERVQLRNRLRDTPEKSLEALERGHLNAQTRSKTESVVANWCAQHATCHPAGHITTQLDALPKETEQAIAILGALTQTVSGDAYQARTASLEQALKQLGTQKTVSIAGCLITSHENQHLIYREPNAMGSDVPLCATCRWDERFRITSSLEDEAYRIAALGEEGWLSIQDAVDGRPLPRVVLPTIPALKHLDTVLCVPHIGYEATKGLNDRLEVLWAPRKPLASAPFTAMNSSETDGI